MSAELNSLIVDHGPAVLIALFIWWFGTGLVFVADARPRRALPWTLGVATLLAGIAVAAIVATRDVATPLGAYVGFAGAVALWGWHELTFLSGLITGPRRAPCPPGCAGWTRFWCAAATVAHHEVALLATLVGLFLVGYGADNQVAAHTFALLFAMRISAKLNLFLGVPNVADALMPPRLDHLKSYFRRAPMNPLFPLTVTAATAGVALLAASAAGAAPFDRIAATLLATLLALAVLEHWFLIAPLGDAALWRWLLPKSDARRRIAVPSFWIQVAIPNEPPRWRDMLDRWRGAAVRWRRARGRAGGAGHPMMGLAPSAHPASHPSERATPSAAARRTGR